MEKDLTLKIANYLKEELTKYYNVNVILTHDGVNFPKNDASDLAARAMVARDNNADLYVSVHINDNIDTDINGAYVFVTSREELPKYKEGMTILGNKILNNLNSLGIKNNGVVNDMLCQDKEPRYQYYDRSQADYYADIRHAMRGDTLEDLGDDFSDGSGIPTVLIEHCYMNNSYDIEFLDSEEDLEKLAKADADAIIEYLGLRLPGEFVTDIKLDKESINLLQEGTEKITVTVEPDTAKNKGIKYITNNEEVVTVDEEGNIVAVGEGTTEITVTSMDNSNVSKKVTVNVEKQEVKFEKEEESILVGDTKKLNVKISPSWIENKNIIWECSNEDILEINDDGIIIGKQQGTVIIKVIWEEENLSDEITINVIELSEDTKIEINNYRQQNGKITNIGQKVKIEDFISNIVISDNLEVEIKTTNENQEYIGTNTKVIIKEKQHGFVLEEYECLIYGDISGDGKIDSYDMYLLRAHMIDMRTLTDNELVVANTSKDEEKLIDSYDMYLLRAEMIDMRKIDQE